MTNPDELSETSLERVLEAIILKGAPRELAFWPNAIKYWRDRHGQIKWELVNMTMPRGFEEEELSPEVKAKFAPRRVRIVIIRNSDGQRRFVYTDFTSRFWWEDGNGGCDCVRHVEFERAADPDFVDSTENPCGSERYDIELPLHMTGDDE